jgi:hypothetical protein
MDASQHAAAITALEAATDVLMVALSRRPDPDLEVATAALKAREIAIHQLVASGVKRRPPDTSARLRRILDNDKAVAEHLKTEMDALRERLADTRQMMNDYRSSGRVPEQVR